MKILLPAVLTSALVLSACSPGDGIGHSLAEANAELDRTAQMLAGENVSIDADGQPNAEITPQGDFLVNGKAVQISSEQRDQLIAHREQLIGIATQGLVIGKQGVALANKALRFAIFAILTGNEEKLERKIETEAEKIEASAMKLCERLPTLLESQNNLAGSLAEFKPYATMTQSDVDDCADNVVTSKDKAIASTRTLSR